MSGDNGESRLDRIEGKMKHLVEERLWAEQDQNDLLRLLRDGQADKTIHWLAESKHANDEASQSLIKSQQCIDEIIRSRNQ